LLAVAACLLAAGCATGHKLDQPQPGLGYLDFYLDPAYEAYWQVERWNDQKAGFKVLYSKLEAPIDGVLRLPMPPGLYRLRVNIQNLTAEGAVEVMAQTTAGRVTPVHVRRESIGSTYVRDVEDKARQPYRRRKVTDYDYHVFRLTATAEASVDFQPRDAMPYAAPAQK
jgi:hypothetical protein